MTQQKGIIFKGTASDSKRCVQELIKRYGKDITILEFCEKFDKGVVVLE